jgi:acetyl-CoA acetyltransferase
MSQAIAAIVGVAESDLGVTNKSIFQLQAQAIDAALADSGLSISDVDALLTNGVSTRFSASLIGEYLGIAPSYIDTTFAGGASYEIFLARAAEAVRAGLCEVALVSYGSNQRSARLRRLGGVVEEHAPDAQFEAPYGPLSPMSLYAMAAQRHMHEFGTTPEQLAEVAVAAREWALLNPKAFTYGKGPLTVGEVLSSEMVSSPLHKLDCCLITDGGGAVVITSVERARDLEARPVYVLGHGEASTNVSMSQVPDLTSTGGRDSSSRAYKMAGIGPSDIDVTQIYDSFTITVLLTLEALGFCERGEAGSFVEGGRIAPGGDFPLNTSGGGLSYCHPGMYGIFLIIEAVRQLRGEAGARQVAGARTAVSHGTGGLLGNHATVVLGTDS